MSKHVRNKRESNPYGFLSACYVNALTAKSRAGARLDLGHVYHSKGIRVGEKAIIIYG